MHWVKRLFKEATAADAAGTATWVLEPLMAQGFKHTFRTHGEPDKSLQWPKGPGLKEFQRLRDVTERPCGGKP